MVAHPQQSAPSSAIAAAVRAAGGREALEERIEVQRGSPHAFRDVTSPTEAYDLILANEVVGQVVCDRTELKGLAPKGDQWVLVQRDGDYSLAVDNGEEAISQSRSIVAARLAETAENPSAAGQVGPRTPARRKVLAGALIVAALLALGGALVARKRG